MKRYVPSLIPSGNSKDVFKGFCPFHQFTKFGTRAFYVLNDRGFYHCFDCGAHGSIEDFMVKMNSKADGRVMHDELQP